MSLLLGKVNVGINVLLVDDLVDAAERVEVCHGAVRFLQLEIQTKYGFEQHA